MRIQKRWKNLPLAQKLTVLYFVACLIPLLGSSLILYRVAVRNMDQSATEFAEVFSSQVVTGMESFAEGYNSLTASVLVDTDLKSYLYNKDRSVTERLNNQLQMRRLMTRLTTIKPEIRMAAFLTREGSNYSYGADGENINVAQLWEEDWVQEAWEGEETFFLVPLHDRPYCGKNPDRTVISVVRKIYGGDGEYLGLLVLDLPPSAMLELSSAFLAARNDYSIQINVCNEQGNIFYDSEVSGGNIPFSEIEEDNLLRYRDNTSDYVIRTTTVSDTGIFVNVVIPKSSLYLRANRTLQLMLLLLAVSTILIIWISRWIGRYISEPIGRLRNGMRDLEAEEYSLLEMDVGNDEIGQLVTGYNRMVKRMEHLIQEVYVAGIQQKNAEYLALQTQVNPHMLFNTLESIRMKALMNDDDETAEMIRLLAVMFRTVLENRDGRNTIRSEIEYADSYIRLQNLRFHDKYVLETEAEQGLLEQHIISLVLQPILENSVRHGARRNETLHMTVQILREGEGQIRLRLRDDGKGMSREELERLQDSLYEKHAGRKDKKEIGRTAEKEIEKEFEENVEKKVEKNGGQRVEDVRHERAHIGLENIAERLRLYYGEEHRLEISSREGAGTEVSFTIPAKTAGEMRSSAAETSRDTDRPQVQGEKKWDTAY